MDLNRFAQLIVDYCVSIGSGDEVYIGASLEAFPLVKEIYKETVKRGGYPRFNVRDEELTEIFYRYAPDELLDYLSPIDEYIAEKMDVRISIVSSTHTKPLVAVPPEKIQRRNKAQRRLVEIFFERDGRGEIRWTVTAYPTRALAQEAGMSILEFQEFVERALKLHRPDPVEEWRRQTEWQEDIREFLEKVDELRIVGEETDITFKVGGRTWINDDGRKNMPGGEVFTGPHEDATEGTIYFDIPVLWRGMEMKGVRLRFERGRVVEARAKEGQEYLEKIISVDEGASIPGELAFGLNYDITRPIKNILFDEKIGGTMHMALGSAYPYTGGRNKSSIHMDMVKNMEGARVYADGDLIYQDGRFVIDELRKE